MRRYVSAVLLFALLAGLIPSAGFVSSARAASQAEEFLNKLRDAGYNDTANDYLEYLKTSPLAPAGFDQNLVYEQAKTLLYIARKERDAAKRKDAMTAAEAKINEFITKNPNHPKAGEARQELANTYLERARSLILAVERESDEAKQAEMLKEARSTFEIASKMTALVEAALAAKYKALPPVSKGGDKAKLEEAQGEFLEARFRNMVLQEEIASTYDEKDPERKKKMRVVVDAYDKFSMTYRNHHYYYSQYGRLGFLRALTKMKDVKEYKEAISYFEEIFLGLDDTDPESKKLHGLFTMQAIDTWLAMGETQSPADKKGSYEKAIEMIGPWIKKQVPAEANHPEFQGVRFAYTKLLKAYAATPGPKTASKDPLKESNDLLKEIVKIDSPYKDDARRLLAESGGVLPGTGPAKTFADARLMGNQVLEEDRKLQEKMKLAKGGEADVLQKQHLELLAKAKGHYELALQLADAEVLKEDINYVRFLLCWLNFQVGNSYDALVLGDFLLRVDPNSSNIKSVILIMMTSYGRLMKDAEVRKVPTTFEQEGLVNVAQKQVELFPGTKDADQGLAILLSSALRDGEVEKAASYLSKFSPGSPRVESSALSIGMSVWGNYLRAGRDLRALDGQGAPPLTEALQASVMASGGGLGSTTAALFLGPVLRAERMSMLEQMQESINKQGPRAQRPLELALAPLMKAGDLNSTHALASLYLATCYLEAAPRAKDPKEAQELVLKAIAQLEDPRLGALTLVAKKSPLIESPGYAPEAFRVALRAYIGNLSFSTDPVSTVKKVKSVMDSLSTAMGATKDSSRRLLQIYIGLATDLKRQMESKEIGPETRKSVSRGYTLFLTEVVSEASDFRVLNWIADDCYRIGLALDALTAGKTGEEARVYYDICVKAYEKILGLISKGQTESRPGYEAAVKLRQAELQRKLGQYSEAIAKYEAMLYDSPNLLEVQIAAAQTLVDWARSGKPEYFDKSIAGHIEIKKTGKFVIWGWRRISEVAMAAGRNERDPTRQAEYRKMFHEARLNMARARMEGALAQSGEARSTGLLAAKRDIDLTLELYPPRGNIKAAYDLLLRQVKDSLK